MNKILRLLTEKSRLLSVHALREFEEEHVFMKSPKKSF